MIESEILRRLPKVCLHEHLDGCLRPATVAQLAERAGVALPCDPKELGRWFFTQASAGSLVGYLRTFELTVAVLQEPTHLERVASELVADLAADGVIYAEVRWAPEQHLRNHSRPRDLVAAVWSGLQQGMEIAAAGGQPIEVRQILSSLRHRDPNTWTAQLVVESQDLGVVGFDLAGPEQGFGATRFARACRIVTDAGLGLTIHAGEAAGPSSVAEALACGATRLGHGIRLIEDISDGQLGPVATAVRDAGVTFEVCPSSNLQTGIATMDEHPISRLRDHGLRICVSCDNRLMSNTTATQEFARLSRYQRWTVPDITLASSVGLEAAFVDDARRIRLQRELSSRPTPPSQDARLWPNIGTVD